MIDFKHSENYGKGLKEYWFLILKSMEDSVYQNINRLTTKFYLINIFSSITINNLRKLFFFYKKKITGIVELLSKNFRMNIIH